MPETINAQTKLFNFISSIKLVKTPFPLIRNRPILKIKNKKVLGTLVGDLSFYYY